jgi:hypothetical protein
VRTGDGGGLVSAKPQDGNLPTGEPEPQERRRDERRDAQVFTSVLVAICSHARMMIVLPEEPSEELIAAKYGASCNLISRQRSPLFSCLCLERLESPSRTPAGGLRGASVLAGPHRFAAATPAGR